MADTANDKLLDSAVSHQIGLMRYSNASVRKIIALLNRAENDLVRQILRYDFRAVGPTFSRKRLEKMLDALRVVTSEAYAVLRKEFTTNLKGLAEYEAEFQVSALQRAADVELDLVVPTASQLFAAVNARPFQGRLLKDWYAGLEAGAQARLRQAIQLGFTEGETIDQIVRRVRGTKARQFKDGILEVSRRGAEAMVRTAINHVASAAREELYKANTDVIKGVLWVSTLDSRTTILCASRDGNVYPPDNGPRPPAHVNCRSTTAPVLKSWKEMGINLKEAPQGTRASMDGQLPAETNFDKWLRTKPTEFQADILGVTKAKLFRDGGLTLDRFVDRVGMEYTLDELRKREAKAFEKAGLNG
jgi:SPP1 gp7 family putative phage head morphogenesis protein